MKTKKKLLIIGVVIAVCILLGLAFLREKTQTPTYLSTFYLLFEDDLNDLLGNLTGEFRVILSDNTVHSTFKFAFSSLKQDQPQIEAVQILTTYTFYVYDGQDPRIVPAPPLPQNITIHADEQITLFDLSTDISNYKEPMVVFGFARDPTIWVYLSNGQVCVWKAQQGVDSSFPLWSGGHEWRLTELVGKSETSATTISLVISRLTIETDKDIYLLGENVTITLTNIGNCSVMISGFPAWQIFTYPEGEPVYPKLFANLAWKLEPGENRTFIWNQYNQFNESYCIPGTYVVRDTQGWGLSTSFKILPADQRLLILIPQPTPSRL